MRMVVAQVMEDYEAQAMGVVNKRLDVDDGRYGPLLGMTGTVTGMIVIFGSGRSGQFPAVAVLLLPGLSGSDHGGRPDHRVVGSDPSKCLQSLER